VRSGSLNVARRPDFLPSAQARCSPACVRSMSKSRSNCGVKVHCLQLGGTDLTSAAGRMTMNVLAAVADGRFPGGGMLIKAEKGWFLARSVKGEVTVAPAGTADTAEVFDMSYFPGGGVLIQAEKGWFLARAVNGAATVARAGTTDIGYVFEMGGFPGVGMLIQGAKGWFVAREVNGIVTIAPAGTTDTGDVSDMSYFPGGGVLIRARKGLFLVRAINGAATVAPAGATYSPDDKPTYSGRLSPISGSSITEVILPWRVDKPGLWSFQVIATSGLERPVGEPQRLTFVTGTWWERWWRILANGVAVMSH
jgi:hypothetical protein